MVMMIVVIMIMVVIMVMIYKWCPQDRLSQAQSASNKREEGLQVRFFWGVRVCPSRSFNNISTFWGLKFDSDSFRYCVWFDFSTWTFLGSAEKDHSDSNCRTWNTQVWERTKKSKENLHNLVVSSSQYINIINSSPKGASAAPGRKTFDWSSRGWTRTTRGSRRSWWVQYNYPAPCPLPHPKKYIKKLSFARIGIDMNKLIMRKK